MKKGLISETAGLAAAVGALAVSVLLSGTSIWAVTGAARSGAGDRFEVAAVQPARLEAGRRATRVKAPLLQPHWQQRFFDFDRNNARLANRLGLAASFRMI